MRVLLVVYDNDSYTNCFPIGLGHIASVLLVEGVEVDIYNQDMYHYPEAHLTEYLDKNHYDIVAVSVIGGYYQYRKLLKLSTAINNTKSRPLYVLGGHGPTPDPDYFLTITGADIIVRGEGEITIIELIRAIAGKRPLADILGIAYKDGPSVVVTGERPLIQDLETIPMPAYHLFPMNFYWMLREPKSLPTDRVLPILSARGCTFKCSFCYRMDKGLRNRSAEAIIEEIRYLQRNYGINYFAFYDELLMSSIPRTVHLAESFIKAKLAIKWNCFGRLNYAQPDVLRLMKEAGCIFISYGIEAMDDAVLRKMSKGLRVDQVTKGIEATYASGITPGFNIIFGSLGDTRETLAKGVDFLLKYDDGTELRTIRPVTPYPGSPLYYYAIENGLLRDCADFYENKHANSDLLSVNFTEMSDDEVHQALLEANTRLLENYYQNRMRIALEDSRNLYIGKNSSFRGFRQI